MKSIRTELTSMYNHNCPCCNTPMQKAKANQQVSNTKTKGHLFSCSDRRWREDDWFFMCYRCNQDQGALSLWEWLAVLQVRGDPRYQRVLWIVNMVKEGFVDAHIARKPPLCPTVKSGV